MVLKLLTSFHLWVLMILSKLCSLFTASITLSISIILTRQKSVVDSIASCLPLATLPLLTVFTKESSCLYLNSFKVLTLKLVDMFDIISFAILVLCIVFMFLLTMYFIVWYIFNVVLKLVWNKVHTIIKNINS